MIFPEDQGKVPGKERRENRIENWAPTKRQEKVKGGRMKERKGKTQ